VKELKEILDLYDDDNPEGLNKLLYFVGATLLMNRGGDGVKWMNWHFIYEEDNKGRLTGQLMFNPLFTKRCQGGDKKLAKTKYIGTQSAYNKLFLQLFRKMMEEQPPTVTSEKSFSLPIHAGKTLVFGLSILLSERPSLESG